MAQSANTTGPSLQDLKDRFSAGRIPSDNDFFELIDTAYVGWRAISHPSADSGLRLDGDGLLTVAQGEGIKVDAKGVSVLAGLGIDSSSAGVSVKLAAASGLGKSEAGLVVNTGPGLKKESTGVTVDYGDGLVISGGKLAVKTGEGVSTQSGALKLDPVLLGTSTLLDVVKTMTPTQRHNIFYELSKDSLDPELEVKMRRINAAAQRCLDIHEDLDNLGIIHDSYVEDWDWDIEPNKDALMKEFIKIFSQIKEDSQMPKRSDTMAL